MIPSSRDRQGGSDGLVAPAGLLRGHTGLSGVTKSQDAFGCAADLLVWAAKVTA
jgi:hypothetical protein